MGVNMIVPESRYFIIYQAPELVGMSCDDVSNLIKTDGSYAFYLDLE